MDGRALHVQELVLPPLQAAAGEGFYWSADVHSSASCFPNVHAYALRKVRLRHLRARQRIPHARRRKVNLLYPHERKPNHNQYTRFTMPTLRNALYLPAAACGLKQR